MTPEQTEKYLEETSNDWMVFNDIINSSIVVIPYPWMISFGKYLIKQELLSVLVVKIVKTVKTQINRKLEMFLL